ncbi:MAG: ribonuclease III [Gemmataceae bacterium]|jgi:ribonuclease-3|nr:ribonuclease III [Gemmataceae bacterium]
MTAAKPTPSGDPLHECEKSIGYSFSSPKLLVEALTHPSGATHNQPQFERLEFLGDAVLGFLVVDWLYRNYPQYQEGEMTQIKSSVVNRSSCAEYSRFLGLNQFLRLGRGLDPNRLPENILADVFESLIGALYLDGGMTAVSQFLERFLPKAIEKAIQDLGTSNHKSRLQQLVQQNGLPLPKYVILDEQGPDHARSFKIAVIIRGRRYPAAWGPNKKIAEARAAQNALAIIEQKEVPFNSDMD